MEARIQVAKREENSNVSSLCDKNTDIEKEGGEEGRKTVRKKKMTIR